MRSWFRTLLTILLWPPWWYRVLLIVLLMAAWRYVGELLIEGAPVIAYPQAFTLAFIH